MAISQCISLSAEDRIETAITDAALQVDETGYHGTPEFPVAVYLDDVSCKYVNWHWHKEFEIGFVTEGSVLLGSGNRSFRLERGDIFFVNSNVLHSMRNSNTAPERAVFKSIAFDSSMISDNMNSVFYTRYLFPILSAEAFRECIVTEDSESYKAMIAILETVWNLVYSEETDYEIKVRNGLSSLFCCLNQIRKAGAEASFPKVPNFLPEKRVQIILDHIHSHYQEKITIADLSKAASISKTEVLRCFKIIMGLSPISYLNSYRLQKAAYTLVNSEDSVQDIAAECGFDDNSYFSKLFKKKYMVTPRDFRQKYR